jgi:hypothetical protein
MFNKILGVLALIFLAIQFKTVDRTNPPVTGDVDAPKDLAPILRRSCYDCHSNETEWPWYSKIAPFSWWVVEDVNEAREHMNFSEWDQYDFYEREKHQEECYEEVSGGEMPLEEYLWLHPKSRLNREQQRLFAVWADKADELPPGIAPATGDSEQE